MWVSYEFMHDSGNNKIDAHTYIHESGHLLGLDDYYNYDNEGDPLGALEMQSYNVSDQGSHTKLLNGWFDPYVIDGSKDEVEIKLNTASLYNEAILINDNWNGTPIDEYLLVEYYTPLGNNYHDAASSNRNYNTMYTEAGLRIYHVDARLVNLNSRDVFQSYATTLGESENQFIGASNSRSLSYLKSPYNSKYKLSQLMQADVNKATSPKHFLNGGVASNSTLYHEGQSFEASSVFFANNTQFNNGEEVGYRITCLSLDGASANIRIEKI